MTNVVPHIKNYLEPKARPEALDTRRADQNLTIFRDFKDCIDFSSNVFLSLAASGLLRMAFLDELARHPNFGLDTTSSRLLDGNSGYRETVKSEVAKFHHADEALIVSSNYKANGAIYTAILVREMQLSMTSWFTPAPMTA
ncbi:hypothetical protein G7046_g5504 [Stylonectria norvegica]|nr:hypothetical protein G7046_g5504 [Stylonectria norvegica]